VCVCRLQYLRVKMEVHAKLYKISRPAMTCRDLLETLKRLNKGAQKVQNLSGSGDQSLIFRGSIAFCLKDVQRAAMQATVVEFMDKLNQLVQGGQNFVSSIYSNLVSSTAFPPLCRDFYKTLEKVRAIKRDCVPFEDSGASTQ
jgi:hypothetical protein